VCKMSTIDISQIRISSSASVPDNHPSINTMNYVLDPLSVIIKLAIISNKPVGTKLYIHNNVVYFQEPGIFQGFCRYVLNTNKTDLQFMYNPIHLACTTYLSPEFIKSTPRIKSLFTCAQLGLQRLMETYKSCSIIHLCLNYYYAIINNAITGATVDIFYRDVMTHLYSPTLVESMSKMWTQDKIKIVLNLIDFLIKDESATSNVKSLENIMENIDKEIHHLI
jgi:hypothetical protein